MALTIPVVKKEIRELKEQRSEIDRKIEALERYLPLQENPNGGTSARGGVDIRPSVRTVFDHNNNQALRVKDLVDEVARQHPEVERAIIEKKMVHVKRTILEQTEYGKYRLAMPLG